MRRVTGNARIDAHKGRIIASDESGYGSWAGPLVVCAATGPLGWHDARVQDSKVFDDKAGRAAREALYDELRGDDRFQFAIVILESDTVDRMGVYQAQLFGHTAVLGQLQLSLDDPLLVVDGSLPVDSFGLKASVVALPKADALVPECSLASIIAKVTHDRLMRMYDATYPGYGFAQHTGYGTPEHEAALDKLGICPIHRRSFAPIKKREEPEAPAVDIMALIEEMDS